MLQERGKVIAVGLILSFQPPIEGHRIDAQRVNQSLAFAGLANNAL
ncbi:MAG TPA: hypothetical protein VKU42_05625 [Candidatus Angelobacter sp.]|nr:hypothetical protein [Candidatus Angelobacter sp.]